MRLVRILQIVLRKRDRWWVCARMKWGKAEGVLLCPVFVGGIRLATSCVLETLVIKLHISSSLLHC